MKQKKQSDFIRHHAVEGITVNSAFSNYLDTVVEGGSEKYKECVHKADKIKVPLAVSPKESMKCLNKIGASAFLFQRNQFSSALYQLKRQIKRDGKRTDSIERLSNREVLVDRSTQTIINQEDMTPAIAVQYARQLHGRIRSYLNNYLPDDGTGFADEQATDFLSLLESVNELQSKLEEICSWFAETHFISEEKQASM